MVRVNLHRQVCNTSALEQVRYTKYFSAWILSNDKINASAYVRIFDILSIRKLTRWVITCMSHHLIIHCSCFLPQKMKQAKQDNILSIHSLDYIRLISERYSYDVIIKARNRRSGSIVLSFSGHFKWGTKILTCFEQSWSWPILWKWNFQINVIVCFLIIT